MSRHTSNQLVNSSHNQSLAPNQSGGRITMAKILNCLDQANKCDKADYQAYSANMMKQLDVLVDNEKKNLGENLAKITEKVQNSCETHSIKSIDSALDGFNDDISLLETSLNEYSHKSDETLEELEAAVELLKNAYNME